jgi:hypothetical protein
VQERSDVVLLDPGDIWLQSSGAVGGLRISAALVFRAEA